MLSNTILILLEPSGIGCPPPELIMTEADNVDPDSEEDEKCERKDSLDVQEDGRYC